MCAVALNFILMIIGDCLSATKLLGSPVCPEGRQSGVEHRIWPQYSCREREKGLSLVQPSPVLLLKIDQLVEENR
jgi:hypothetical protein